MSLSSLQNYGEWYYTRYFPSTRLLREKILKKSQDEDITNAVMERLQPLFIEKNIIESRVNDYISQGKTLYFIRQKLGQKKFDTALVEEIISEQSGIFENPETYRRNIESYCKKAKKKGLSRRRILYELGGQYPESRTLVSEILQDYDDREVLDNIIVPRLLCVYNQEKTIQKCLQMGFSLSDIQYTIKNI